LDYALNIENEFLETKIGIILLNVIIYQ